MFDRILRQIQEKIRQLLYVLTIHAEEEMSDEDFTIFDIERCILTGAIIERQKDKTESELRVLWGIVYADEARTEMQRVARRLKERDDGRCARSDAGAQSRDREAIVCIPPSRIPSVPVWESQYQTLQVLVRSASTDHAYQSVLAGSQSLALQMNERGRCVPMFQGENRRAICRSQPVRHLPFFVVDLGPHIPPDFVVPAQTFLAVG